MRSKEEKNPVYKIGDVVYYGTNGICSIEDITTLDFQGISKDRLYYVLADTGNTGKIFVPVDGDTSKMRKLISKEDAMTLISEIKNIEPLKLKDEDKPEPEYKEVLKKYDCVELIRLIKCIYFRKLKRIGEGKKVTVVDDKYMKLAEEVLHQEIGSVLGIPKDQVLNYLINKINEE